MSRTELLLTAAALLSGVFAWILVRNSGEVFLLALTTYLCAVGVLGIAAYGVVTAVDAAARGETTRRKQPEEEPPSSGSLIHYLSKYANDFIILVDANCRLLECNERMVDFYGYTRQELIGMHAAHLRSPEARDDFFRQIEAVQTSGSVRYETIHQRKDGSNFPVEVILRAIDIEGERLYHAVIRDVTDRKETERALQDSERKYRELVEYANSIILRWTKDGRITFLNEFGQRFFGYSADEITGRHVMGTIVPATDSSGHDLRHLMEEICADPVAFEQNVNENMRRNGEHVWIAWTNRIVRDVKGQVIEILSVGTDITERKRAIEALRQSNERYQTLTETAMMGVWQFMPDGSTIYVNPAMRSLLELDNENDLAGRTFNSFFAAESLDALAREHRKHLQGIRSVYEAELVGLRGGRHSVVVAGAPLFSTDGKLTSLICTFMAITERKRAETELHRLKNYLANIIDSMPAMLIAVDPDGRVVQWNTHAEVAAGVPSADAIGRPVAELLSEFSPWILSLQRAFNEHQPASLEKVLIPRNGERRFFDLILYPLMTNGERGAVLRIEDSTERAKIQELMVQTEKMMSLGGLAAGMAHEINNPLGIISQAAQNIERRVSPDLPANLEAAERVGADLRLLHRYFEERKIGEFIRDIRAATLRAARIIANILQFSRKSNIVKQPASLREIVDRTVELAASDYDLKKSYDFRSIEIVRDYEPSVPDVPVVAAEIEQVVLNLLKNSGQALIANPPQKKPKIVLRTRRKGQFAVIEVEDNGPGIEESLRPRVFEPFFTTKEPGVGTGLGLSVSHTIVTVNHSGFISVESKPGSGACFTVELPIMQEGR